jgi:hypothetical protein
MVQELRGGGWYFEKRRYLLYGETENEHKY